MDGPQAVRKVGIAESAGGALVALVFLVYSVAVFRTAWICDDAFITFRAVDNWIHGFGLVSNPPERVLGFTNPLWALVVAIPMRLQLGAYAAGMGLSLLCAGATAIVVARGAATRLAAAAALTWLALSSAYVDYSTSGLENPLAHLLLAVFFVRLTRERTPEPSAAPFLLAALVTVNRMDHALLVVPAVVLEILAGVRAGHWARPAASLRKWVRPALLGTLPATLWLVFSVVYYGFPFPNTAYAKLNTTIPASQLALHGVWYLMDAVQRDPLTPLVIVLAMITAARARTRAGLAVFAGLSLQLVYVVRVGGDFMAGRFLTAPFLVAVVWLSRGVLGRLSRGELFAAWAATAWLGVTFSTSYQKSWKGEGWGPNGIVDERAWYTNTTALVQNIGIAQYAQHDYWKEGVSYRRERRRTAIRPNVGFAGFAAGPGVHIIDELALTDPLLARIPFDEPQFRIGHFGRRPPAGYEATIKNQRNQIRDPCLHEYYDVLWKVIRGPLFAADRWAALWALNTGRYDALVDGRCRR